MRNNIKDLEKKLKEKTGEDKLSLGIDVKTSKKTFNVRRFLKLAKEMREIFPKDEHHTNPAF